MKLDRKALAEVAAELERMEESGELDFLSFQKLYARAFEASGGDNDQLEFFDGYTRESGWWDWIGEFHGRREVRKIA